MKRMSRYGLLLVFLGLLAAGPAGCGSSKGGQGEGDVDELLAEIEAQRQRGARADVKRLNALAENSHERVSAAAISALGQSGTTEGDQHLAEILRGGADAEARANAAVALGANPSADPQTITPYLAQGNDPVVRAGAAQGLARWSSPQRREALPTLVAALDDPDPKVRAWAIRGIHRISVKRFLYDPAQPPQTQRQQIDYIKRRLRDWNLL